MKKIIMFVVVFAISAPVLADDLNPPDWAGAPGTVYGIWNFDVESPSGDTGNPADREDYPEEGAMVPHDGGNPNPAEHTETSEEGAHKYMIQTEAYDWEWLSSYEERDGVMSASTGYGISCNNFEGDGTKLIRVQITWWPAGTEVGDFWVEADTADDGEEPFNADDHQIAEIENVGDGWRHTTYEFEIPNPDWEGIWIDFTGDSFVDQIVIDTICYSGDLPSGPGRGGPPSPILIDPNVMLVYETDETEGDFGVSLLNEPPSGATITITVDPNADGDGPNEDITLLNGIGFNNNVTLTFNDGNWDVPQIVTFKAIDDDIPEPPDLIERHKILLLSSWPAHPTDANYVGERIVTARVMDNDQATILFTVTPVGVSNPKTTIMAPVQLWEELGQWDMLKWRKIGITLQVAPSGGPVKLNAEVTGDIEGDNLPLTDPCLPYAEIDDPNGLIFTAANYNVSQNIKIWAYDDAVLQVLGEEGEYPSAEGDQNYQAEIVFTVVDDGGDDRYADMELTVEIEIEDNECGAFGILPLDVGNPNAATDPNYRDEDGNPLPDCYVNIYDVIELATKWLDCSYLQDPSCDSYL